MKQAALQLKRPAPKTSAGQIKKSKVLGSAKEPIDLDEPEEVIELEDSDTDDLEKHAVTSTATSNVIPATSSIRISQLEVNDHSGPSTRNPLAIQDPPFDLDDFLTHCKPKAILKDPDLDLLYFKTMIKGRQVYDYLVQEFPWYRVTYETRGTTIRTPRWTCVWGCDDTGAPMSAYKIKPRPMPKLLQLMKDFVEKETDAKYNFVLVNFYEKGKDSISWHSDDESFLGPLPCIASLSLGSPRDFQMKNKVDKSVPVEKWSLESGDMVVMRGTTQSKWLHSVPKRVNASGRINITFRRAMNTQGTNNYYRYNVHTGPVYRWRRGRMVEVT